MSRHPRLLFLAALLVGLALGLGYAWVIAPRDVGAAPADLSGAERAAYIGLVARAYRADGDLQAAGVRLRPLGEPAVVAADELGTALVTGQPFGHVQALTALASALGSNDPAVARFAPAPPLNLPAPGSSPESVTTVAPPDVGSFYEVVDSESLCESDRMPGLLEVTALDADDEPLPGLALRVQWDGGSDRFITGLHPTLGDGYADFRMAPGMRYSLAMEGSPVLVDDILAEPCDDGAVGSWRVVIRRVE